MPPVFRFAPSPNGALHLGHAFSALLNRKLAQDRDGTLLLRIEDIDTTRCSSALEAAMLNDLHWLGIEWDAKPMRQSERFAAYGAPLQQLRAMGLAYPAFLTRREIRQQAMHRAGWPTDPDGAPHYPGEERNWTHDRQTEAIAKRPNHTWRLDMAKAVDLAPRLTWQEHGEGIVPANPAVWGDVVLARADTPTSYHLSVTVDDAAQGVTDIVRGCDLYHATSVHRLLQYVLGLPEPRYHHHKLILDADGNKLSKSTHSTGLAELRAGGTTAAQVRESLGFA